MGEFHHLPVTCSTKECPHFKTCCKLPSTIYYNEARTVDVLIVGQGAGWQEEKEHKPWIGKAGQLLRTILRDIRQDHMWDYGICLTNTVRCRPTETVEGKLSDRPPTKAELEYCMPYLFKDIIEIHPKVLLLTGASTASAFGLGDGISRVRGKVTQTPILTSTFATVATFHPAGVLRQPGLGRDMRKDIEMAFNLAKESQKI